MWIETEEDLRKHIDDGVREGTVIEYKAQVDNYPGKGRGADLAGSICSLANAGGGQVLLGVVEREGAPLKVRGVDSPEEAQRDVETAISKFLPGIEPRPDWRTLPWGETIVGVIDVQPSVRLVAFSDPQEPDKIRYPVRTGDRLHHLRPHQVEERILSYGPRAQRIRLERLRAQTSDEVVVHCFLRKSGKGVPAFTQPGEPLSAKILSFEEFGVVLGLPQGEAWIPYEWISPFIARDDEPAAKAAPSEKDERVAEDPAGEKPEPFVGKLAFAVAAQITPDGGVYPLPPT